jgi:hypothetical protein
MVVSYRFWGDHSESMISIRWYKRKRAPKAATL